MDLMRSWLFGGGAASTVDHDMPFVLSVNQSSPIGYPPTTNSSFLVRPETNRIVNDFRLASLWLKVLVLLFPPRLASDHPPLIVLLTRRH